jgi:acetyl esterase/lipase
MAKNDIDAAAPGAYQNASLPRAAGQARSIRMPREKLKLAIGYIALALLMFLAGEAPCLAQPAVVQAGVPGGVIDNVNYLGPAGVLEGTLYLPENSGARLPGIVLVHGGAWHFGSRNDVQVRHTASFLQAHGYVVLTINYLLGTRARPDVWPENLMDCKIAVQWLRVNARAYNIDPAHIGIGGFSAGAHLATLVGFTGSDPGLQPAQPYPGVSTAVQAVLDFYGPPILPRPAYRLFGPMPLPPSVVSQASPIDQIRPGLPPIFISYGAHDPNAFASAFPDFIAALAAAGVPHQVFVVDAGHGFDPTAPATDVSAQLLAFLNAYLLPHG